VVALVHHYGGTPTLGGRPGTTTIAATPGSRVRVRVVNTDNGTLGVWVGGQPWALLAVDGNDVNRSGELRDVAVNVPAGGRVDLAVTAPSRVEIGNAVAVAVGAPVPRVGRPAATLDLLHYGAPQALSFDPERADRHFHYDIGRRPGFLRGRPGMFWTVNGHLDPDVPMFLVREGETVRMTITNSSGETHPMHLHGHRVVVLARNGAGATGSPWWTDTLDVGPGETYEVAFAADNPGIWMDHCHNLPHAVDGLVAHVVYEGVTTPFLLGPATRNTPE
jgi:FtsP/CotA-like multicopper oxidase with cupredoxin domain